MIADQGPSYERLERQVEDIRLALLGGELMPDRGLLSKFNALERRMDRWERQMDKAKYALMGALLLGSYGLTTLLETLLSLFK